METFIAYCNHRIQLPLNLFDIHEHCYKVSPLSEISKMRSLIPEISKKTADKIPVISVIFLKCWNNHRVN